MAMMNIKIIDMNSEVVEALKETFSRFPEVEFFQGNILDFAKGCIVSPANSYGYMDGGIDKMYFEYFGQALQNQVIDKIGLYSNGKLDVGNALLIRTSDRKIPFMMVVPTMEMPEFVESDNIYRAMSAILRTYKKYKHLITELYCPGLGTGVGGIEPKIAALHMAQAYKDMKQR